MTKYMGFNNTHRTAEVNPRGSGHFNGVDHSHYEEDLWLHDNSYIDIPIGPKGPKEGDIATLNRTICELSKVVGGLKEQLTQHIKLNEALESDLERAEAKLSESAREREMLMEKVRALSDERQSYEDSKRDLDQITRVRDTLAKKVHDLGKMLAMSEQRVLETSTLIDRFRQERNDVSGEIDSLDSQFTRAMKVIEELRHELSATRDKNQVLTSRLEFVERQKQMITSQRDALKEEIADTRNALAEIRQNIIDASVGIENDV